MKKILIVSHTMELGGAERALIGLLNNIDYSKYSVDLFLERHFGELMDSIPDGVNLLPENSSYACLGVPLSEVIKKCRPLVLLGRYIGRKRASQFVKKSGLPNGHDVSINYSHKYTCPFMPMISETEYDLAVSFLTPHYFVMQKVKAKKKAAWIHTDYTAIEFDRQSELEMWRKYDRIVSISSDVSSAFLKAMPELSDKITVIENMHPAEYIREKSGEFIPDEFSSDSINLLSVGRYCTAKNFDNVPYICRELIDKYSLNIKWHIIGYGTDGQLIEDAIKKTHTEENVILLGKKDNPYPYMKHCDFYVQPSRFEGNAVTVNEALILSKKVILTDYPTAKSQITDGVDGVIVPIRNSLCAKGIADYILDTEKQKEILSHVEKTDYSKKEEINKFYRLASDNYDA